MKLYFLVEHQSYTTGEDDRACVIIPHFHLTDPYGIVDEAILEILNHSTLDWSVPKDTWDVPTGRCAVKGTFGYAFNAVVEGERSDFIDDNGDVHVRVRLKNELGFMMGESDTKIVPMYNLQGGGGGGMGGGGM